MIRIKDTTLADKIKALPCRLDLGAGVAPGTLLLARILQRLGEERLPKGLL